MDFGIALFYFIFFMLIIGPMYPDNNKYVRFWCFSVVMALSISIFIPYMESHTPENVISQKQESINEMQQKLQNQLKLISQGQQENREDIGKFSKELREARLSRSIKSFGNATEDMQQLVRLIQGRDAYLTKLAEVKQVTENGLNETIRLDRELTFVRRELEGIRRMEKVMANGKSLSSNVDEVLKKYTIYMEPGALSKTELRFKSAEEIWQQYK